MTSRQASIASTYFDESATCEPTWKLKPRTRTPRLLASSTSGATAPGSQPNLRERSTTADGLRNDTRSSNSARRRYGTNLRISSGLSATNRRMPKRNAARISESRLIGCVWMQRPAATPCERTSAISPAVATSNPAPRSRSVATTAACGSGFSA